MKTALARTTGSILALTILLACVVGACAAAGGFGLAALGQDDGGAGVGMIAAIVWVLGASGAVCVLLRRVIDADDRTRELGTRLAREGAARQVAEEMLAETRHALARVVRQQESAREGERGRIAQEIHDELGQMLLALRIELSLLQVASNGIHPSVYQKSTAMVRTLDLALGSLRQIVASLRPLPPDADLHAAVARLLAEFTHLNGIAHHFEAAPAPSQGARTLLEGEAMLYRVLQEALADLARQAVATEVHVVLGRDSEGLLLQIDDNGRAAPDGAGPACACGLKGMRERIEAVGGQLLKSSTPGTGTTLTLHLPAPHRLVHG